VPRPIALVLTSLLAAGCAHGRGARQGYAGWSTVKTEHFTVYSPEAGSDAEEVAERLELVFQALTRGFFPGARLEPIDVLVFAEPEDAASAASDAGGAAMGEDRQRGAMVLSLRDRRRSRRGGGTGSERFSSPWQTAAAGELSHRFLNGVMDHPPPCLREGLGHYVSTVQIEDGAAIFGHRPNDLAWDLAKGRALPLSELLAAGPQQFHGPDGKVFQAGCWGFVHYLLGGEDGKLRPSFDALTAALVHGADGRAAAVQAFPGVPWPELEGRVRAYQVDVLGRRSIFHPYPISLAATAPTKGTAVAADPTRINALLLGIHRR
jgi:hypothetical protein